MQKVPFKIFQNLQAVQSTMAPLVSTKYGDYKESYHVKRLSDELQSRYDDFKDLHQEAMKNAEWEEDKKTLTNKVEMDAELDELFSTKFEMKWAPIPIGIIQTLNPTPEQFTILEHLMDPGDLDA